MEGNFGGRELWRIHYKIMFGEIKFANLSNSLNTKRQAKRHFIGVCSCAVMLVAQKMHDYIYL